MYNLGNLTLKDMTECGAALRQQGIGATSMEDVSNKIVHFLYDHLVSGSDGQLACALVRFFKTHRWDQLSPDLQAYARRLLGTHPLKSDMPCLTLLATAGEKPEWNHRMQSKGHQAIPLASEKAVEAAPMISNLIKQLGVEVSMVVQPDPRLMLDLSQKTFNVFHVPDAVASPFIPAQQEFVAPHQVKSVVGCGGILPSGSLFAVILFAKCGISLNTAELFKPLALNVKLAVLPFDAQVFAT